MIKPEHIKIIAFVFLRIFFSGGTKQTAQQWTSRLNVSPFVAEQSDSEPRVPKGYLDENGVNGLCKGEIKQVLFQRSV